MHRVHMCVTTGARLSYIYFPGKMEVYVLFLQNEIFHMLSKIILEYPKVVQLLRNKW